MPQIRRGEASQAQGCFAGRTEVLTALLGVGSEVTCRAGGELERRGLRRGSRQGWARGCLQQEGWTPPPTGFGSEVPKPAPVGLDGVAVGLPACPGW